MRQRNSSYRKSFDTSEVLWSTFYLPLKTIILQKKNISFWSLPKKCYQKPKYHCSMSLLCHHHHHKHFYSFNLKCLFWSQVLHIFSIFLFLSLTKCFQKRFVCCHPLPSITYCFCVVWPQTSSQEPASWRDYSEDCQKAPSLFDIIKHPRLIASFKHYWGPWLFKHTL